MSKVTVNMVILWWLLFSCYVVSDSPVTPWTVPRQAPLSMGFPRQEYWSGLPFSSPGYLPDPGIKPASPTLAGRFFTTEPPGKPNLVVAFLKNNCLLCISFGKPVLQKPELPCSPPL